MTTPIGLFRTAGWLLLSRLAAQGLLLVAAVVLARRLGDAGFGGVAFIVAAVYLANVATTFGTDMVLIREIAAGLPSRWAAALALQLGLSAVAIGVLEIAARFLAPSPEIAAGLRIYAFALPAMAAYSVATAVLRGRNRMAAYGAVGVVTAALQAVVVVALVGPATDLAAVAWLLLGVQVASAGIAVGAAALRALDLPGPGSLSRSDIVDMARSSGTVGMLGVLGVVFQRLPILALAGLAGPAATGWFAGAQRLVDASKVGHIALFTAVYPAMAARSSDRTFDWAWRASVGGAVVIAVAAFVAAEPLVRALYGPGFEPAAVGLAILAWAIVPSTISGYLALELLSAGIERAVPGALLVALVTLVVLGLGLFALMGWTGVAWAMVAAEIVQAVGLRVAVLGFSVPGPSRDVRGVA
jgi:O-antigen/teichoic acid export membrane protein